MGTCLPYTVVRRQHAALHGLHLSSRASIVRSKQKSLAIVLIVLILQVVARTLMQYL